MPVVASELTRVSTMAAVAISEVDVQKTVSFVTEHKETLKPIDIDVRDGKRRVTSAKGPKRKKVAEIEEVSDLED